MTLTACSTYSFLWDRPLREALYELAQLGFAGVELMASAPHMDMDNAGEWVTATLEAQRASGIPILGVNPPGLDLNLASTDPDWRRLSQSQYCRAAAMAGDIGAKYLVVVPGRRHPLLPCPVEAAVGWFEESLELIHRTASRSGLTVVLENTPSNFLDSAVELVELLKRVAIPDLGICYDVANGFMVENPKRGLEVVDEFLSVVHLSDTTRARWRHDPIGNGDVSWPEVHEATTNATGQPVTVLETIHLQNIGRGLQRDLDTLRDSGWMD